MRLRRFRSARERVREFKPFMKSSSLSEEDLEWLFVRVLGQDISGWASASRFGLRWRRHDTRFSTWRLIRARSFLLVVE
jgi:hypothetical protein